MKIARILGFFVVSIGFFIISYISYTTVGEGYVWVLYLVAGMILAIIGAIVALFNRDH